MTGREQRVVNAFIECVRYGRFDAAYVTVLVEDAQRYGWMSDQAKTALYSALESMEPNPEADESEPVQSEDVDPDEEAEE